METEEMSPHPNPTYATEDEMVSDLIGEARMLGRMHARKWRRKFEPEDFVQVALLSAVVAFRAYDPSHGISMRNWIRSKMRWAIHDHIRAEMGKVGSHGRGESIEVSADNCPPALLAVDDSSALFAKLDVERLLTTLPLRTRRIVQRLQLRQHTLETVATDEEMHLSRVSQLNRQGLRAMRKAA